MVIQIGLVGRRQLFRAGLRHILNGGPFEVGLEVDDVSALRATPNACRIFIVDKPVDIASIADDMRWIKAQLHSARMVVLADTMDADELTTSFALGMDGYLLADISPAALCESLRLVLHGEKVFPREMATWLASSEWTRMRPTGADRRAGLSLREAEVVSRIAGGLPNKVIATELTITELTVKVHLKNILKKLGVANRTQAAIWAVRNGMGSHRPAAALVSPAM